MKIVSAKEAILKIEPYMMVMLPPGCAEPQLLIEELVAQRERFNPLSLVGGFLFSDYSFLKEEYKNNFKYITWHIMGRAKDGVNLGMVEFIPLRYIDIIETFSRNGSFPVDAMLVHTSPPDENGNLSLGVSVSYPLPIAMQAPVVIAQINEKMPRTLGNSFIHESQVAFAVECEMDLVEYPPPRIGEVDKKIASYVSGLIPDGATLQVGIGNIPEAILMYLTDKKDIGIHSILVDNMIPLVEKGVINNTKKTYNAGKMDIAEIMGTKRLFDFANNNPMINMQTAKFTHDPRIIGQIKNFISVNSCIEVDFSGQVNAETIGELQVAGIGGQFDFVLGAHWSEGGKSIFAFPSTSGKDGKISRILSRLSQGASVSTPRFLADYVVTEYGIAELKGKTMSQRAKALINIAHPKFRNELLEEFKKTSHK